MAATISSSEQSMQVPIGGMAPRAGPAGAKQLVHPLLKAGCPLIGILKQRVLRLRPWHGRRNRTGHRLLDPKAVRQPPPPPSTTGLAAGAAPQASSPSRQELPNGASRSRSSSSVSPGVEPAETGTARSVARASSAFTYLPPVSRRRLYSIRNAAIERGMLISGLPARGSAAGMRASPARDSPDESKASP